MATRKNKGVSGSLDIRAGKRVRSLRLAKGWTQQKLAENLDISFQQVQKYESGRDRMALATIQSMADIFGVSVTVFFMRPGREANPVMILADDELHLLALWRTLPQNDLRTHVTNVMRALAG